MAEARAAPKQHRRQRAGEVAVQTLALCKLQCRVQGYRVGAVWEQYAKGELLGEGKYGKVWGCTEKTTGTRYACKELRNLPQKLLERALDEVAIMSELSGHGNIVSLHAVYREGTTVHIVMELCEGGDLFDAISRSSGGLSEDCARGIFLQLAHAVRHCHRNSVLHRDLKPENIFLQRLETDASPCGSHGAVSNPAVGTVKLGDFGLAARMPEGGGAVSGQAGSSPYSAPEVEACEQYGEAADVWSLGIILCCMLTGGWPLFDDNGVPHPNGSHSWRSVSPSAEDLIKMMLSLLPEDRPAVNDILAHPWLVQGLQGQHSKLPCIRGSLSAVSLTAGQHFWAVPGPSILVV